MKENERLSTDELFQKVISGQEMPPELFIDPKEEKQKIRQDIERLFSSISQFSEQCYVSRSHMTDFFNNDKKIGRDRMIAMFIVLGYNISKIKSLLNCFGQETLYIKNQRDYLIIQAIREADQQGLKKQQRLDQVENRLIELKEHTLIKN